MELVVYQMWFTVVFSIDDAVRKIGDEWLFLWQNGDIHNYQFKLSTIDRVFTFATDDRGE